jgi:hypothetical protein
MASPVTKMASSLAEIFQQENDKTLAQKLFELRAYQKSSDTEEFRRVAMMISEFALAQTGESETQRELEFASLRLAGLAHGGRSLLSKEQQERVLKELLPRAMGDAPESSYYSAPVSQLLLRHLNPADKYPIFSPEVKEHLDTYLDKERVQWLIGRVESESIESPFDEVDNGEPDPIKAIKNKYGFPDDEPVQEAPEKVAKLNSDSAESSSRIAELAERVDRDASKRRIDMDLRVDAQNRINELFSKEENAGWAEKNVWSKVKGKVGEKVDRVFLQDPIKYPKESLFSRTLVDLDPQTLLTRRELLKFKSLGSFKATFPSSKVSDDVYNYAALSAMSQGIVYPYIKSTFTDPNESYTFLEKMTHSLIEAGYDIDSIRVSPHLKKVFEERIKPVYAQENALEEAPEVAIDNPDVSAKELGKGLGDAPVKPFQHVAPRFNEDLVDSIELIKAKISAVNDHPLKVGSSLFDPEAPKAISDLDKDELLAIYELSPYLNLPDEGWKNLADGSGLEPEARKVVEKISQYVEKIAAKALPDENGVVKMDPEKHSKQFEFLKSSLNTVDKVNPQLREALQDAISLLSRPKADKEGFVIPDQLWLRKPNASNSNDEYVNAMSMESLHRWEGKVAEAKEEYLKNQGSQPTAAPENVNGTQDAARQSVDGGNDEADVPKQDSPDAFFYNDTPPPHLTEVPPSDEEFGPQVQYDEGMDISYPPNDVPFVDKSLPPESTTEAAPVENAQPPKEEVKGEAVEPDSQAPQAEKVQDDVSPYESESIKALSKTKNPLELDGDAIEVAAKMTQQEVEFFNLNSPTKEQMTGTEFSNLRRNIREIRDAINPFQENPNEVQIEIMKKVSSELLASIVPEEGIAVLAKNDLKGEPSTDPIADFTQNDVESPAVGTAMNAEVENPDFDPMVEFSNDRAEGVEMAVPQPEMTKPSDNMEGPPDMDVPPLDSYEHDMNMIKDDEAPDEDGGHPGDEQTSIRRGR